MPDPADSAPVTIDQIVAAWNSHDPARIGACFHPDGTFEDVPLAAPAHGQAAIQALFTTLFQAFPDLVMTPEKRVEHSDALVWEWILTGTHRGEFNGIAATEASVQVRGVSFCVVHGGRIAETREYWDLHTVLKQLGAL